MCLCYALWFFPYTQANVTDTVFHQKIYSTKDIVTYPLVKTHFDDSTSGRKD